MTSFTELHRIEFITVILQREIMEIREVSIKRVRRAPYLELSVHYSLDTEFTIIGLRSLSSRTYVESKFAVLQCTSTYHI